MEKKPAAAPTAAISTSSDTNDIKPAKKIERVLYHLVIHGSINRLEAEKAPVFDHALPSTMSNEARQRLGLEFSSIPEKGIGQPRTTRLEVATMNNRRQSRAENNEKRIPIKCDESSWINLILPFDIPGKVKQGDTVLINLNKPPEKGKFTLIDYGTDSVEIAFYEGQRDAKGRFYYLVKVDL